MKYYTIAPLNHLELVKDYPYHLVVAQHIITNDKVFEFYREMKKKGAEIILDNGAFETGRSMDVEGYIKIVNVIEPNIVVIPDVWKNLEDTLEVAEDFMNIINESRNFQAELMFVPQGQTLLEYVECYNVFMNTYGGSVNLIGLPYRQWNETTGVMRREIVRWLTNDPNIKFHLLGLWAPCEIYKSDAVSFDTSLPFKLAAYGDVLNEESFTENKFDFNVKLNPERYQMAYANMKKLAELAGCPTSL